MNNYLDPDNTGQNYVNGIDAIDLPDPLAVLDVGNLKRLKNFKDSFNFDHFWTVSIAMAPAIISQTKKSVMT